MKFAVIFFALLLAVISTAAAQNTPTQPMSVNPKSISKAELQSFVKATTDIRQVQEQSVLKMQQSLSKNGMSFQRFRQIMLSKQNPKTDTLQLNDHEKASYNHIQSDIQEIQTNAKKKMISSIQHAGLKVNRYQQIYLTLQKSKDLQNRVKTLTEANH